MTTDDEPGAPASTGSDEDEAQPEPPTDTGALVCWRPARQKPKGRTKGGSGFDVLVHREAPDDPNGWALPRQQRRTGETLPEAAVRALAGHPSDGVLLVPRLAQPLHVLEDTTFWAARLRARETVEPRPSEHSTGELTWMPADAFEDVLADQHDRTALTAARDAAVNGRLETRPVVLVRHAKARPRSRWSQADADRPLVDLGRRQAAALVPLLDCWYPEYLVTSPWRRCVDTLTPYVQEHDLRLRTRGGLSERGHRSAPGKAGRILRSAVGRGGPALICTHRPVLPAVLHQFALRATPEAKAAIPDDDPYLAPSEVLVAHIAVRAKSGTPCVLAVELYRPSL